MSRAYVPFDTLYVASDRCLQQSDTISNVAPFPTDKSHSIGSSPPRCTCRAAFLWASNCWLYTADIAVYNIRNSQNSVQHCNSRLGCTDTNEKLYLHYVASLTEIYLTTECNYLWTEQELLHGGVEIVEKEKAAKTTYFKGHGAFPELAWRDWGNSGTPSGRDNTHLSFSHFNL
jgi:hypothetical protein